MPQVTRREIVLGCTAAVALSQAGAAKASAEELAMDATGQAELVRKGEISAGELSGPGYSPHRAAQPPG
jgi:hypothetical protein